jgi:Na+-driven multidrug efflux pump
MVLFGVVRATGAVMAPLFVLTLSLLLVRFPLAEALMSRYQIDAVWWSFPISSALSAALAVLYYKYGGWRTARMVGGPTQPVVAPES